MKSGKVQYVPKEKNLETKSNGMASTRLDKPTSLKVGNRDGAQLESGVLVGENNMMVDRVSLAAE